MKSLAVTPRIIELIKANSGAEVREETIRVFETTAVSTRPLNKVGSIFNKARMSEATLRAMADYVNGGGMVPLHTLHMQKAELPVGRVFHAEVVGLEDGEFELRSLFYLPASDTKLVEDIELGVIGEVSIGAVSASMLCSECGWDYRGEDATFLNFIDHTCANGHVVGENGVHLRLNGLERWLELSLVSIGASPDAKIKSRARALLGSAEVEKLAAAGKHPDMTVVFASTQVERIEEVDVAEIMTAISDQAVKLAAVENDLAAAQTSAADLTTQLTAAKARVTELEAELAAKSAAVEIEPEVAEFLKVAAKEALVASGSAENAPEGLVACVSAIQAAKVKLHTLPVGGVAASATVDTTKVAPAASRYSSFKISEKK